ncbi:hypothetical protein FRC08_009225, partial [Ceratobasidium sp. 394]
RTICLNLVDGLGVPRTVETKDNVTPERKNSPAIAMGMAPSVFKAPKLFAAFHQNRRRMLSNNANGLVPPRSAGTMLFAMILDTRFKLLMVLAWAETANTVQADTRYSAAPQAIHTRIVNGREGRLASPAAAQLVRSLLRAIVKVAGALAGWETTATTVVMRQPPPRLTSRIHLTGIGVRQRMKAAKAAVTGNGVANCSTYLVIGTRRA